MLIAGACTLALGVPAFSQETLPGITVVATNYKYLKTVGGKEIAVPAKMLQRTAAAYDVKNAAEFYEDEYDNYFISFFIPEGQILAAYDKSGKLIRTAEKYKNVKLPTAVATAVIKKYPDWKIAGDAYLVSYYGDKGSADKRYKLLLEKGNKRIKINVNEAGEFL